MYSWQESPPERVGMDAAGLRAAVDLVAARGATAQLCVLRDGQVVLDRRFGCEPDALFLTFSVSKPFVALLVHLLAERGRLDLDDPVAAHWPEYARHGKDAITVRHVLAHRAGVPLASGSLVGDTLAMADWDRAVRQVRDAKPGWPAGQVPAYHILSFGFILGELVRRVTGVPVDEALRTEFLDPLRLRDTHLGLPDETWRRHVPLRSTSRLELGRRVIFNRRRTRQAVIPAATVSSTARDLALFYQTLLDGGVRDGVRVLRPETLAAATAPSGDGERDRLLGHPVRWSHGFQLGGPPGALRPMGGTADPLAFGHNGSSVCNTWADPTRRLVVAYVTDLVVARREGLRHQAAVADTLLAACA